MTDLCWWCCHSIPGESIQLPTAYNHTTKSFSGIGQFCSIGCVKAFGWTSPLANKPNVNNLITMMVQDSQPDAMLNVQRAPPWQCLRAFGGIMSIDEFRASNQAIHFDFKPIERVTYDVEKKYHSETLVIQEPIASTDRMFTNQVQVINNPLKIKTSSSNTKPNDSILCLLNRQSS
jgi:hypothetical protein